MHQKLNVLNIFSCMLTNGSIFKFKFDHIFFFFFFIFSSPRKIKLKIYYSDVSLPWALAFFYHSTSFASPTTKPIGLCQWIM
jgi:hypothetical protein